MLVMLVMVVTFDAVMLMLGVVVLMAPYKEFQLFGRTCCLLNAQGRGPGPETPRSMWTRDIGTIFGIIK